MTDWSRLRRVRAVEEVVRDRDAVWYSVHVVPEEGDFDLDFDMVKSAHGLWSVAAEAKSFGCGTAEVAEAAVPSGDGIVVLFRFGIEPWSEKSNDHYRYVAAFGEFLDEVMDERQEYEGILGENADDKPRGRPGVQEEGEPGEPDSPAWHGAGLGRRSSIRVGGPRVKSFFSRSV